MPRRARAAARSRRYAVSIAVGLPAPSVGVRVASRGAARRLASREARWAALRGVGGRPRASVLDGSPARSPRRRAAIRDGRHPERHVSPRLRFPSVPCVAQHRARSRCSTRNAPYAGRIRRARARAWSTSPRPRPRPRYAEPPPASVAGPPRRPGGLGGVLPAWRPAPREAHGQAWNPERARCSAPRWSCRDADHRGRPSHAAARAGHATLVVGPLRDPRRRARAGARAAPR
ncbi:MAG: hypothetical protein QOG35_2180 [Solirubrobacteraceae bacterium]|jgi:hypothetical protein|nr:hypothetical protein [Solirubrobacteraceae bacterium]